MDLGRVDVHSHLLPDLDDGCSTPEESAQCARALIEMGYTHAFCTPHVWPSLENNAVSIIQAVQNLQAHFDSEVVALKLMSGGEINLLECWPKISDLPKDQIVSYGMAGKHVLFDFWADTFNECRDALGAAVEFLISNDLQPIMAHPERISAMREPGAIEQALGWGCKLQMNSYCLSERVDETIFNFASRLLKEGKYFLIGSDTHKPTGMAMRQKGLQKAIEIAGEEAVGRLTIQNPRLLFGPGIKQ
jgi:protein-tyrosine phosphatase